MIETELEAANDSKSTITNIETQPNPSDVMLSHKNAILVNNIFTTSAEANKRRTAQNWMKVRRLVASTTPRAQVGVQL